MYRINAESRNQGPRKAPMYVMSTHRTCSKEGILTGDLLENLEILLIFISVSILSK